MPLIWFTSDLHFGHRNIIQYCKRPFKDVEHMNEELITRWNQVVDIRDIVYVLGDFCLGTKPQDILPKLKGQVVLIKGNHDHHSKDIRKAGFIEIVDGSLVLAVVDGPEAYNLYLRHVPYPNGLEEGRLGKNVSVPAGCRYHFCGHVHGHWRRKGNVINVGVDVWDYRPVGLSELLEAKP